MWRSGIEFDRLKTIAALERHMLHVPDATKRRRSQVPAVGNACSPYLHGTWKQDRRQARSLGEHPLFGLEKAGSEMSVRLVRSRNALLASLVTTGREIVVKLLHPRKPVLSIFVGGWERKRAQPGAEVKLTSTNHVDGRMKNCRQS